MSLIELVFFDSFMGSWTVFEFKFIKLQLYLFDNVNIYFYFLADISLKISHSLPFPLLLMNRHSIFANNFKVF